MSKEYSKIYGNDTLKVNAEDTDIVIVNGKKAIIFKLDRAETVHGADASKNMMQFDTRTGNTQKDEGQPIDVANCNVSKKQEEYGVKGEEDNDLLGSNASKQSEDMHVLDVDPSDEWVLIETVIGSTRENDEITDEANLDVSNQEEIWNINKTSEIDALKKYKEMHSSDEYVVIATEISETRRKDKSLDEAKGGTSKQKDEDEEEEEEEKEEGDKKDEEKIASECLTTKQGRQAGGSYASENREQKEVTSTVPPHEDDSRSQYMSNDDWATNNECVTVATYEDKIEMRGSASRETRFDIRVDGNKLTHVGDRCTINLNWKSNSGEIIEIDFNDFRRTIILDDPWRFPTALRRFGSCQGAVYDNVMKAMRTFQDNGMHAELNRYTKRCLEIFKKKGDIDMQVVVLIQHAVMGLYHTDAKSMEKSTNQLLKALKLAEKAKNHQYLTGVCLLYLGYVYSEDLSDNKAFNYLNEAEAVLKFFVSDEMKALLCYVYGVVFAKRSAIRSSPSEEDESKALENFYLDARHIAESNDTDLVKKRRHWAMLKHINLYLRSNSDKFMLHPVKQENLQKAKNLLDDIETKQWSDASKAVKVYFFANRADYFGRIGQIGRALEILKNEGAPAAQQLGHNFMIALIESKRKIFNHLQKDTGRFR